MILNRAGAKFYYNGTTYIIGDKVFANDESEYAGLYGTITAIYDGDDKETDNETPDIVCNFLYPVDLNEITQIENRFSPLCGTPKKLDDLGLDMVIMAPEVLQVLTPVDINTLPLYIVRKEWNYDGDGNEDITVVADIRFARYKFLSLINQELLDGRCTEWPEDRWEEEIWQDHYSCSLKDEYCTNHYNVSIEPISISMNQELIAAIGKQYVASQFRKQFAEQIECWEEVAKLTPAQMAELIGSPEIPGRIRKRLEENGYLRDAYWESVSEVAFSLVDGFIKKLSSQNGGTEQ